jgi:hypothetical protein
MSGISSGGERSKGKAKERESWIEVIGLVFIGLGLE